MNNDEQDKKQWRTQQDQLRSVDQLDSMRYGMLAIAKHTPTMQEAKQLAAETAHTLTDEEAIVLYGTDMPYETALRLELLAELLARGTGRSLSACRVSLVQIHNYSKHLEEFLAHHHVDYKTYYQAEWIDDDNDTPPPKQDWTRGLERQRKHRAR